MLHAVLGLYIRALEALTGLSPVAPAQERTRHLGGDANRRSPDFNRLLTKSMN